MSGYSNRLSQHAASSSSAVTAGRCHNHWFYSHHLTRKRYRRRGCYQNGRGVPSCCCGLGGLVFRSHRIRTISASTVGRSNSLYPTLSGSYIGRSRSRPVGRNSSRTNSAGASLPRCRYHNSSYARGSSKG